MVGHATVLYVLSVILAVLPIQESDFDISSEQWTTNTTYDDFTDEVDNITAFVVSEDMTSGVRIACLPNNDNSIIVSFVFLNEYLGSSQRRSVRWRIGEHPSQDARWLISDNDASEAFLGKRSNPRTHALIAGILASTTSDRTMIFEATDYDNDRHRGKVVLKGAKESVEEVLQSCDK